MSSTAAEALSMIVVMGVTGSGKSYFINKLDGRNVVEVGDDLNSCTVNCAAVPVNVGRTKVMFIDTPGFDDTHKTDSEILEEISRLLTAQYQAGVDLKGVIYLHRITDTRYAGSSIKTLEIFKKICGDLALKNVMLVSTRWGEVDERTENMREQQLRDNFWAYMVGHGSTLARFTGSRDSAMAIASQLISRRSIVLDLQKELVDEGKVLNQTAAGAYIQGDLSEQKAKCEQELQEIEKLRRTLQENDRAMRRKAQADWEADQRKLATAQEDEKRLRKEIAAEVRAEIEGKKSKKGKSAWKFLPVLPALVGIIEMFVGIPPGSTATLTSWFTESGFGQSVSDFFANF